MCNLWFSNSKSTCGGHDSLSIHFFEGGIIILFWLIVKLLGSYGLGVFDG
jgi:hypothetical protein